MKHVLTLLIMLVLLSISQKTFAYSYVDWVGSVNGTWVLDVSGDMFRFTTDGYMIVANTLYAIVYIDSNAYLYMDGIQIGSISYVVSNTGSKMTTIVDNEVYIFDIYISKKTMTI